MLLFFDTETSGVQGKPYLVQLAAILTEDDGTLRGSCNLIVKPDGYTIPEEASNIHGITTEIAERAGVPLSIAIAVFNNLAVTLNTQQSKVIAHNKNFDLRIMNYCYERGGWPSRLIGVKTFCTMEGMRNHCRIPPTPNMVRSGIREYKSPRLSEAYQYAFEKPLENAHDALYDVMACKDLYFWMIKKLSGLLPEKKETFQEVNLGRTDGDQFQQPESDPPPT